MRQPVPVRHMTATTAMIVAYAGKEGKEKTDVKREEKQGLNAVAVGLSLAVTVPVSMYSEGRTACACDSIVISNTFTHVCVCLSAFTCCCPWHLHDKLTD